MQEQLYVVSITLIPTFIAIIIGLLFYITRAINKVPVSLMENPRGINQLSDEIGSIKACVEKIREGPFIPLSPDVFLIMLATQSEFWQKLFKQRADKVLIASVIASNYIQENDNKE